MRHISLFAACYEIGLTQKLSEKAIARLQDFCDWRTFTADKITRGDSAAVLDSFLAEIGYEQWLKEQAKTPDSAKRQLKNVADLVDWLKRIGKSEAAEEEKSLSEVVSQIMLMDILERQDEAEAGDQVSLMTLHAAKGLEFPHVFLVGMEENLLPHQNSIESENIEEERRLAYVGITRAQRSCTLSYCTHRKRYGEMSEAEPSRFLSELPEEDLEWAVKKPVDSVETKERGRTNFAHLKTMLS